MKFKLLVVIALCASQGASATSQILEFDNEEELERAQRNLIAESTRFLDIKAVRL